jgi:hypothetical protein
MAQLRTAEGMLAGEFAKQRRYRGEQRVESARICERNIALLLDRIERINVVLGSM